MTKTVLMADDDMHVSQTYADVLRRRGGIHVERCHDGDSAIEAVSENAFDLIILDIMMPHRERYDVVQTQQGLTTGVFVYRDIRNLYPSLPILILTNVDDGDILALFPSDDPNLQINHKKDNPPSTLTERVKHLLSLA